MSLTTRRRFVREAALAAAALYGCPIKSLELLFEEREQNAAALDPASVRRFASEISGHVITPEAPEYESARLVFNRAFDLRPALIVRCASSSDVAGALEFAQ